LTLANEKEAIDCQGGQPEGKALTKDSKWDVTGLKTPITIRFDWHSKQIL
jgi:hypothetical protein